jgi:hypothetical protein
LVKPTITSVKWICRICPKNVTIDSDTDVDRKRLVEEKNRRNYKIGFFWLFEVKFISAKKMEKLYKGFRVH